jgi:hypothetical protein
MDEGHNHLTTKNAKGFILRTKKTDKEKPRELFTPAPRCYLVQSCLFLRA